MNKNFFSALELEKTVMFIILVLIILVAAFNIASTLIMMVMEKTKDIAILKSMGMTAKSTMRIFMIEGLVIGFNGINLTHSVEERYKTFRRDYSDSPIVNNTSEVRYEPRTLFLYLRYGF